MPVSELGWIQELTHLGVSVVLAVGLTMVWRAWQAERRANSAYQREFLTHVAELNQIPEALDRLRTEVLMALRLLRGAR